MNMKKQLTLFLYLSVLLFNASAQQKNPLYEFRGVWVASVVNCDFPSSKNLTTEEQKAEFIKLADLHQRNGMNALIVQVRPAGDALYPSKFEPWSEYLTGKQGVPPNPYYDPLEFMINETHKRGMEFHAWLNPYRAVFSIRESSVAATHLTKTKPYLFLNYDGKKFFNPALQEVRTHFVNIINDLIERYAIDGIHIDDYFYPYPDAKGTEFPDWKYYKEMGNGLSKADWRRSNCDSIIKQIWEAINAQPRRVKFGISPFGVWRNASKDPKGSNTQAGITNYDNLYADILLWLKKGWVDYCVPQLYWERGHNLCDFDTLLAWWNKNTFSRHLYIGQAPYRAGTTKGWRDKNELPNEIINLRKYSTTKGSVYFSSISFNRNPNGWNDSLQQNYYSTPAIVPPMPWIDSEKPDPPTITEKADRSFGISYKGTKRIKGYVLFTGTTKANAISKKIILKESDEFSLNDLLNDMFTKVFVASLSVNNNLSEVVELK
jgi:uncharacterized lipoprotein YddW (UPF0748 family)